MTFEQLFNRWYADKKMEVKAGTAATQANHWMGLRKYLGERDVCSFGKNDARILLHNLIEDGLARKTAKDRMALVKQILLFAASELEVPIKPLNWQLKFPQGEPKRLQRFTPAELLRIISTIGKDFESGDYKYLPVLISALTGMRVGEVCGLQWGDIDFKHRVIYVHRNVTKSYDPFEKRDRIIVGSPKTRAGYREIPMIPILCRMLRMAMPAKVNPEHYTISNDYTPFLPGKARALFDSCIKKNKGVPRITFHGLRHTFATLLVESKADVKTVSEILGHSNVTVTLNLYVHPSMEEKKRAVSRAFGKLVRRFETPNPTKQE